MDENCVPPGDTDTRPCAHCGRPVPQRAAAGRPFRYCRDNDGECQRASRNVRMRHRASPGLAGQVSRTWEVVERLDQLVGTLTESLHHEMSPTGVERQVAEIRAETARQIAAAHTERDEARHEAELAGTAAMTAEQAAAVARAERERAIQSAGVATRAAAAADEAGRRAADERDEAHRLASAAAALRAQAETDRDAARRESATLRRERDEAHRQLTEAAQERDAARLDVQRATRSAAQAVQQADRFRDEATQAQDSARQARADTDAALRDADQVRLAAAQATAEADATRRELAEVAAQLAGTRADLARSVDEVTAAAQTGAAATRLAAELQTRLDASRGEADAAQARAARLSEQVSDLASALATLGAPRPVAAAGAGPVVPSAR